MSLNIFMPILDLLGGNEAEEAGAGQIMNLLHVLLHQIPLSKKKHVAKQQN